MNIFVYGTLMYPSTLESLLGRIPEYQPARLDGYKCGRVSYAGYPGIKYDEEGVTYGLMLKDLTEADMKRLDRYEGEGHLYHREEVCVVTWSLEEVEEREVVHTYVFGHPEQITGLPFRIPSYVFEEFPEAVAQLGFPSELMEAA